MAIAISDAAAYSTSPSKNRAAQSFLWIQGGSSQRIPFIWWGNEVPLGATVVSAKLRGYQQRVGTSASRTIEAQLVAAKWTDTKLTFDNKPGVTGPTSSVTMTGAGTIGRLIEIDVTAQMQAVASGTPWFGFRLSTTASDGLYIYSRNAAKYQPELIVEYTMAPQPPTGLSPSSGRAVSVARPTLSFQANGITERRVQFSTSDDFTTPTSDSGWLASTVPLHPMTFDVAVAEVPWWRAAYRNAAGESGFSDPVPFTRTNLATPVITLPADSPNNIVTEPTPPFAWTFANQTAYRVFVTDAFGAIVWDTGRQGGTDQSVTPPNDLPLTPGPTYTLWVQCWDDVAREATPGVPIYGESSKSFTFELVDTVAGVYDLVGSQVDERPWFSTEFKSATAPDQLTFLRRPWTADDSAPWETREVVDATEAFVDGITYAWVDRQVPGRRRFEWMVQRTVNGETSADNPIVSDIITCEGVWIGTEDGTAITCLADGTVEWDASENVDIQYPLGGRVGHPVTLGIFGREGRLRGTIVGTETRSFAEHEAAWRVLADRDTYPYGTRMIVSQSNEAVRAFWTEVVDQAQSEFGDDIPATASIFEVPHGVA